MEHGTHTNGSYTVDWAVRVRVQEIQHLTAERVASALAGRVRMAMYCGERTDRAAIRGMLDNIAHENLTGGHMLEIM